MNFFKKNNLLKKAGLRHTILKLALPALLAGSVKDARAQYVWAFGDAVINISSATPSGGNGPTSCNAIGVLPIVSPGLIFQPGAADPITRVAWDTAIPHDPGAANSLPFPIPDACKQFYNVQYLNAGPGQALILALQKWNYTNALTTGVVAVGAPISLIQGASHHVVSPLRPDGSRYLYAMYNQKPGGPVGGLYLVRWRIARDGTIGTMTYVATMINSSAQSMDYRVAMELTPDGQYLYYCYYPVTGGNNYIIARAELNSGAISTVSTLSLNLVSGMEWVPGSAFGTPDTPRLYVSWRHISTNGVGGVSYYKLNGIPAGGFTGNGTNAITGSVANQHRFGFTDLERSPVNNRLYLAENPNPIVSPSPHITANGSLWQLNPASGAMVTIVKTGTSTPVQVCRIKPTNYSYIIQDQIDGEDYNKYGYSLLGAGFTVNGQSQSGSAIPTVASCNNEVPVSVYNTGFDYTVKIEKGTVSGSVFTPYPPDTPTYTKNFYVSTFTLATEFPALEEYSGAVRITITFRDNCNAPYQVVQVFNLATTKALIRYYMISPSSASGPSFPINIFDPPDPGLDQLQPRFDPTNADTPIFIPSMFPAIMQPHLSPTPPNVIGWSGASSVGFDEGGFSQSSGFLVTGYNIVVKEYDASGNFIKNVVNRSILGATLPAYYSLNLRASPSGYFSNNYETIKNNYYYKLIVTAATNLPLCPSVTRVSYFKILDGGPAGPPNEPELWRGTFKPRGSLAVRGLTVFPNPAHGQFNVAWNCDKELSTEASFVLVDVMGRVVLQKALSQSTGPNETKVSTEGLAPGVYYYTLKTAEEEFKGSIAVQ